MFYGRKGINSFAYIVEVVSCLIEIDYLPLLVLEMGWVTGGSPRNQDSGPRRSYMWQFLTRPAKATQIHPKKKKVRVQMAFVFSFQSLGVGNQPH